MRGLAGVVGGTEGGETTVVGLAGLGGAAGMAGRGKLVPGAGDSGTVGFAIGGAAGFAS
jgi:hypothetical protein